MTRLRTIRPFRNSERNKRRLNETRIRSKRRHLGIEILEDKMMLAGDGLQFESPISTTAEEVGELIELRIDATRDGESLLDETRNFEATVGDFFTLEVQYEDLRLGDQAIGAFQVLTDVVSSNIESVRPLLAETQELLFTNIVGIQASEVQISLEGGGQTETVSFETFQNNPIDELAAALVNLGFDQDDFSISQESPAEQNDGLLVVQFDPDPFAFQDVPNLVINVVETGAEQAPVIVTEISPLNDDGSINQDSVARNTTPTITRGSDPVRFDEDDKLFQNFGTSEIGASPSTVISIDLEVLAASEDVSFSVGPGTGVEAILLLGRNEAVPPDLVLIDADGSFTADFARNPISTNPNLATDVNDDGFVTAIDASLVANALVGGIPDGSTSFLDVNGDDVLTPLDGLRVSNFLDNVEAGQIDVEVTDTTTQLVELTLDAVQEGNSILDENRTAELNVGDTFTLLVTADDLRGVDAKGIASVFADIVGTQRSAFKVVGESSFAASTADGYTIVSGDAVDSTTDDTRLFDEVGALGPLPRNPDGNSASIDAIQIEIEVLAEADSVSFSLEAADDPGSQTTVYGLDNALGESQIVIDAGSELELNFIDPIVAADSTLSVDEDSGPTVINLADLVSGPPVALIFTATASDGATASLSGSELTFTPDNDFSGTVTIDYTANTADGEMDSGVITVTVNEVIDPPVAVNDSFEIDEDQVAQFSFADIVANDTNDEDTINLSFTSTPTLGSIEVLDTTVTYTPFDDAVGFDSFFYTLTNSAGSDTALVNITVAEVNDAPAAGDDFFDVEPGSLGVFTTTTLLLNDSAGPVSESDQSLTLESVTASDSGATVVIEDGNVIYTPADGFTGDDTFTYTISDGELTATGTVNVDVSFQFRHVSFEFPAGDIGDVTVELFDEDPTPGVFNDEFLIVTDNVTQEELIRRPLSFVASLEIDTSNDQNSLTFINGVPFFELFQVSFEAPVDSQTDVTYTGLADSQVEIFQTGPGEEGSYGLSVSRFNSNEFLVDGVDELTVGGVEEISLAGEVFQLDPQLTLNLDSELPFLVPSAFRPSGGTLRSTSTVVIPSGHSLIGSGTIQARVAGDIGSVIRATESLTLGDASSPAGFATAGDVEAGSHTVTLMDSNEAVLGSLTSIDGGTVVAASGLLIDFGRNVVGNGIVDTPNDENIPVINNGHVSGDSIESTITMTGFIKGVGSLDFTQIDGTSSPGFSPAVTNNGSVVYGALSTLLVELAGDLPGSGYDQINHSGIADLGGSLLVDLIDGFVPRGGDNFTILTAAEQLINNLSDFQLPELEEGLRWLIDQSGNDIVLTVAVQIADLFEDEIIVDIVDGIIEIRGGDGTVVPVAGTNIRLEVEPTDEFGNEAGFEFVDTEVIDGKFIQKVASGDVTLEIDGSGWTNIISPPDVDGSGVVSALDALLIINNVVRNSFYVAGDTLLVDPASVDEFPDAFFDVSGDGRATALDALQVINRIARQINAESEQAVLPIQQTVQAFSEDADAMDDPVMIANQSQPEMIQCFTDSQASGAHAANVDEIMSGLDSVDGGSSEPSELAGLQPLGPSIN